MGSEYTVPLLEETPGRAVEMIPALWVTLDTRFEIETSEKNAFFLGFGVGMDLVVLYPYLGLCVRF